MGEVLVIVRGPHGRLVVQRTPTGWPTTSVGSPRTHEEGRTEPWAVTDAPERFVTGQLRTILGVEVRIDRVEAKWKLSQNRSGADVDGVVVGLTADGQHATAAAVRAARG